VHQAINHRRVEDRIRETVHDGADIGQVFGTDDIARRQRSFSHAAIRGHRTAGQVVADRSLHPGIGDNDPDGAEMRAETDHASGKEMEFTTDFVPPEQKQSEETGFQEEREDPFRSQRTAEHITDVARICRPVRAKFKFHHDASGHPDGKSQREDLRPESRHLVVDRFASF
jgi:hypothetical protein